MLEQARVSANLQYFDDGWINWGDVTAGVFQGFWLLCMGIISRRGLIVPDWVAPTHNQTREP